MGYPGRQEVSKTRLSAQKGPKIHKNGRFSILEKRGFDLGHAS